MSKLFCPEPPIEPPEEPEQDAPRCPICGSECETVYLFMGHSIVGCDCCVRELEAWNAPEYLCAR